MILDTSAYSALQQGNKDVILAISQANQLFVPVVVIGELRYGFVNGTKSQENERVLQKFLATDSVDILDITNDTTPHYAELYKHAKRKGKALSNNDLWIAALARQHDNPLLSLDRDFVVLRELLPAGLITA